jgi:glycosyltransferase involved in cell wall biosynthesis
MKCTLVIPCYNEAKRLDTSKFTHILDSEHISLLFVDDGSTDETLTLLDEFAAERDERVSVLALDSNQGKAEAVRQGLLEALEGDADIVGFIDADMATPAEEVVRLVDVTSKSEADVVIGSRIRHLGTEIDRNLTRHILGRAFATAASLALETDVYDTQCGAKFFRRSTALHAALDEEFHSRWAFDVEFLGRLIAEGAHIVEEPLRKWIDVPGSKITLRSMIKAGADLLQIRAHLKRRR